MNNHTLLFLAMMLLNVSASPPGSSYNETLIRYNQCMGRNDPPSGTHVWNGAHGHYEIGNIFVGFVNSFIDALIENKHLYP